MDDKDDRQILKLLRVQAAALAVMSEVLENVDNIHPCDIHNDDVKVRQLSEAFQNLYKELKA